MMMSSECALAIWLDVIIEVQKGLDWVNWSSENEYHTSIAWESRFFLLSLESCSPPLTKEQENLQLYVRKNPKNANLPSNLSCVSSIHWYLTFFQAYHIHQKFMVSIATER